jgi:hypothetical protein
VHEYVSTTVQRHLVIRNLAFVSFAISFGLGWLFHQFELPIYIAPPAGTVAFGAIFWLYDRYLWRLSFRGHSVSGIPNLNGTWKGKIDIRQGHDSSKQPAVHDCTVKITQSWRVISIEFETNETSSHSVMAKIGRKTEGGLHYEYEVNADSDAHLEEGSTEKVVDHSGTAHLRPEDDAWTRLKGGFYNDHGFHRWGNYSLTRVPT